ncbi:MAG: Holliday junction resolvase RecU [Gudongella sp.]|nr:Holliday junction resolvase RecU [Gudongella sp.]
MTRNRMMGNKGRGFEEEIKMANYQYFRRGEALIQKISTPWVVVRDGKRIVSAYPEGKSTLDFRGTVKPGISISFDCKETKDKRGLPLSIIADHQIEYIEFALEVGEVSFILCYMESENKRYYASGIKVLEYWDRWKENKGKKGYNYIPKSIMAEVKSKNGIILDYLDAIKYLGGEENKEEIVNGEYD